MDTHSDNTGEARGGESGMEHPEGPNGLDRARETIADKLHSAAEALRERAEDHDESPGIVRYGKQASEWLDQSADYVENFDYEQANERVQAYVQENPGLSLLVAGAVGLVLGTLVRRR